MQYLCTNTMDVSSGRAIYTLLLNAAGGIEFDAVVLRHSSNDFLLSIGSANVQRAASWLRRRAAESQEMSEHSELVLMDNEPVIFDDQIVGKTTSAAYDYRLNSQVAIVQLNNNLPNTLCEALTSPSSMSANAPVNVAGDRVPAKLANAPFFPVSDV